MEFVLKSSEFLAVRTTESHSQGTRSSSAKSVVLFTTSSDHVFSPQSSPFSFAVDVKCLEVGIACIWTIMHHLD